MMNYRVNAGCLSAETWVHGAEGGGRNIGEACHFYDLFVMLTGAKATSVQTTTNPALQTTRVTQKTTTSPPPSALPTARLPI